MRISALSEAVHRSDRRMPASVVAPRVPVRPRAFELLAAQPITLAGLSQDERDAVVITAVADDQGNEHPVSRFGDSLWNFAPDAEAKNLTPNRLAIAWPSEVPKALVDDAKAALYCALRRGRQGRPWSARAVAGIGKEAAPTLRYLALLGLRDFSQVRPLHLSDHISELRRRIQPSTVRNRLECHRSRLDLRQRGLPSSAGTSLGRSELVPRLRL